MHTLLSLGRDRESVVVLDEYPYLLEHSPELDSVLQRALNPRGATGAESRARLILCGSASSVMRALLGGSAPLRGRAGLDLRLAPFDFRVARALHGIDDRQTALRAYGAIGGLAAYAREMVEGDLPNGPADFDRWICRRVLSPAAPLFSEVPLLLSEDPATVKARKPNLYHAALAGVATGSTTHNALTRYVKIRGASLAPIVEALTAASLLERVQDRIRNNRPTFHPADSLIRFHYAVVRRHQARLARHDADSRKLWRDIRPTFDSQVIGPTFEALARFWAQHFADPRTLGGPADHVGPTVLSDDDDGARQIDVLVAADDGTEPSERSVLALGEAKAGARLSLRHLRRLEIARTTLGPRARDGKLLLFARNFSDALIGRGSERDDVELVGLERLYGGE